MNYLFKPQEILVINSDLKQFTFKGVKNFQQVYVNCFKDSYDIEGNFISGMENKNSVIYTMVNLNLAKKGLPLKTVEGDKTDYRKVKLLVIDAISKINNLMFEYADTFVNLPNDNGKKDARNTYTCYYRALRNFSSFLSMLEIPLIGITHSMEYVNEKTGLSTTKPYYVGKGSSEILPSDFAITLFTDIDQAKMLSNPDEMYRFAIRTDGDIAPKGLYGQVYDKSVSFIPNDMDLVYRKIYEFHGLKTQEEIDNFIMPNILIVGPSGSGKTFSLRNLVGEE